MKMDLKSLREAMLAYEAVYDEELRQELEEVWGNQRYANKPNALDTAVSNAARTASRALGFGGDTSKGRTLYGVKTSSSKPSPARKPPSEATGVVDPKWDKPGTPVKKASPAKSTPSARPSAAPVSRSAATTPKPSAAAKPAAAKPAPTASVAKPAAAKPAPTASVAKPAAQPKIKQDVADIKSMQAASQARQAAPTPKVAPKPTNVATGSKKPGSIVSGFDLFDVVKGYLLGEGFAETEEAAIAIMANMSEDWRSEIVVEAMSNYEKNRKRAAQRAAARNEARKQGKTGAVPGVGYVTPRKEKETWTDERGKTRHAKGL